MRVSRLNFPQGKGWMGGRLRRVADTPTSFAAFDAGVSTKHLRRGVFNRPRWTL